MINSPLSVTRFRIIFSISWLAVIVEFAFLLVWYGWSWEVAFTDSLISTVVLLLASLLMMNTLRFYTPGRQRYMNILVWCIFLTGIWLVLSRWILLLVLNQEPGYTSFLNHSLILRTCIGFLLLGCITLISVLWFNWGEQQENEKRNIDAEKLAREAELFKLRQQMQPHFLFNSLNSINALIVARPEEARKMVQQLSDFLRGTLKKEENQFISFAEELDYLKLYLEIEKVRFGYRLKTEIDVSEEAMNKKVPSLLLQPLMENAIKFGLYGTTGEVLISLRAYVSDNHLIVKIVNPFDSDMQMAEGTGFGLKSVKRRLYLLFGRNDLMEINQANNSFDVVFRIPDTNE